MHDARASAHDARPAAAAPGTVRVGAAPDGTLTYLVELAPEALPPVSLRDLAAAWEAARDRAIAADLRSDGGWGAARLFRFRRADGSCTDLALADRDACCWAGAVDGTVGMHTSYGLSLCLRLLALVDLLAHAGWAAALFTLKRDGAEIDPALLRAAALAPLTREARFDEHGVRCHVSRARMMRAAVPVPSGPTGAFA